MNIDGKISQLVCMSVAYVILFVGMLIFEVFFLIETFNAAENSNDKHYTGMNYAIFIIMILMNVGGITDSLSKDKQPRTTSVLNVAVSVLIAIILIEYNDRMTSTHYTLSIIYESMMVVLLCVAVGSVVYCCVQKKKKKNDVQEITPDIPF